MILFIILLIFLGSLAGALLGLWKKPRKRMISFYMGFAASVMLCLSFIELLPESLLQLDIVIVLMFFFMGVLMIWVADQLLPHVDPYFGKSENVLEKTVVLIIIGIILHNVPEGRAVSTAYLLNQLTGLRVVLGIALHDVPETIALSIIVYSLTKNRMKTLRVSLVTIIVELLSFLSGYYVFNIISQGMVAMLASMTAGIMTYLSIEELLPLASFRKKQRGKTILGMVLGALMIIVIKAIL